MRLVTLRARPATCRLMGRRIRLSIGEVNRAYLKGGNAPVSDKMQAFIEAGGKAMQVARNREVCGGKNHDEQKKLVAAGAC